MKIHNVIIYIFCCALFLSCSSTSETSRSNKSNKKPKGYYLFDKQPNKIYFTILQLNDVYEIAPIQGGKFGGMARVETIRQELLKEDPNTYTVLAGDFLNPSLLGTIKHNGERIKGKQMVDVMNAMNFDLVAFGNHEFDISYEQLQNRLNESNFEWISANVLHNQDGKAFYFEKVKNGKKYPVNDSFVQNIHIKGRSLKVGFISVCIPSNPRDYVTYGDVYIEAERSYNEVKSQSDVVLGLTHLDIDQDKELAKKFPNIPLIMGGHEHVNSFDTVGNVNIAKADANAKSVYIHRFEYDPLTRTTKTKSELRVVDDKVEENFEIKLIVDKWQKILEKEIKTIIPKPYEVIYKAKAPLEARDKPVRSLQTNMGEIITKAMSAAYNDTVDCTILNGGAIRLDDILVGKISAVDIFRLLPFGGSVYKVKMKGSLLAKVLDFSDESRGTGAYLQKDNISKKNNSWLINNEVLKVDKEYTVAVSDYLMRGFDIPVLKETNPDVLDVYKPDSKELSYDIRKAIIYYLKKQ